MTESDLPKGCSITRNGALEAFTTRFFLPDMNRLVWEKRYGPAEKGIRTAYEHIIRYCLVQGDKNPNIAEPLSYVDEETGLTNKVLLSQGISLLGRERFVLVTSNRLGMDASNRGAAFAIGEKMHFSGRLQSRWKTKLVEADVIGVVLNSGLKAARLKPGQSTNINIDQLYSLMDAIISARKAYIREEVKGDMSMFFTQEELDRALNWQLFGETPGPKDS